MRCARSQLPARWSKPLSVLQSELRQLEARILAAVAAAADEAALESVRVSALGKKGAISELLKRLGTMSPEERKQHGPLIHGLKDEGSTALVGRKALLQAQALDARAHAQTA